MGYTYFKKGDLHQSITNDRVYEAVRRWQASLDNPGFCIECGHEADGVEPDARNYECEACGERKVWGAEELYVNLHPEV